MRRQEDDSPIRYDGRTSPARQGPAFPGRKEPSIVMHTVPQVDDLLQGMSEWRNIQEVIRSTFKALHEVIKSQGDAVKSLERQLESKASISDMQTALQRKANIADINHSLTDVSLVLEGKAALYDLDAKADKSEIESELQLKANLTDLTGKTDRGDFDEFRSNCERQIQNLTGQIEILQQAPQYLCNSITLRLARFSQDH